MSFTNAWFKCQRALQWFTILLIQNKDFPKIKECLLNIQKLKTKNGSMNYV